MASTIKIKNSSTASAVPTSSDLVQGELAVNVTDKRIFTENSGGTVVELGTNPSTLTVTAGATIQGLTVGKGAGSVATNTAVGASALAANTSGLQNTGIGANALVLNTSGNYSVAVGYDALAANTTGAQNTALGRRALYSNTTGADNQAVGLNALFTNSTGSNNTAVGSNALQANTTASRNTAVGYQAGYTNSTGQYNTFSGYQAGYLSTGSGNTLIGYASGVSTTGTSNTFIGANSSGQGAGEAVTTGSKNTIIGAYSGNQGGLDIRTASNYIVLSDGDGNPRGFWNASGVFYASPTRIQIASNSIYDAISTGNDTGLVFSSGVFPGNGSGSAVDNSKSLGGASFRWTTVYATTGTINTSDVNQKQDIAAIDDSEKRVAAAIKSLIKKYRFKDSVAEKGDAARIHVGAVAQEVAAAFVAEGLDPARYALFCSDTWYEVNGAASSDKPYTAETEGAVEVTRLGLRYEELLAFVIAAM